MRKPFAIAMSLLLVFGNVLPATPAKFTNAAPPPPISPTPIPSLQEAVATAQPPHAPPSPDKPPLVADKLRAHQAIQAVLDKHMRYWGPRYQTAPIEVSVDGEWAHGVAKQHGQAKTTKDSMHILAHRLPDGTWQALMPGSDDLYFKWLDAMPERLVPAGEKSKLHALAAEADASSTVRTVLTDPTTTPTLVQTNKIWLLYANRQFGYSIEYPPSYNQ